MCFRRTPSRWIAQASSSRAAPIVAARSTAPSVSCRLALLAPQGLSLDGQSLTEPQEGAFGGRLVTQLGVRALRLVYKPDDLLGDSVDIQPLEG